MRHRFGRPLDFVARQQLAPRARDMRLHPTASECRLWNAIRGGPLGVRFRRQVVLGPFIVDFFAPSVGLVIEVDGGVHRERRDNDRLRDEALVLRGLRVLRLEAELVERDIDAALGLVRQELVHAVR